MAEAWAYVVHKDHKHLSAEVPNDPDVLADYALRGWVVTERPGPVPFSPSPDGIGGRKFDPRDYNPAPVSAPEPKKVKSNG